MDLRLAWFITPHGFGHATRSLAVMAAILNRYPDAFFDIYSRLPPSLMQQSLGDRFHQHDLSCDIGLVQRDAFDIDFPKTLARLNQFLPFDETLVADLAAQLARQKSAVVVCDIAALGIAVAAKADLPSVLIENFTWDWIYGDYPAFRQSLAPHIAVLADYYGRADLHLQAAPACLPTPSAHLVPPIARNPRRPPTLVRHQLGVPPGKMLVFITMGGMGKDFSELTRLGQFGDCVFLLQGQGQGQGPNPAANIRFISPLDEFYHPDLIQAADVVFGKLGYSTFAETYLSGRTYGFIPREHFRESIALQSFISKHMSAMCFSEAELEDGSWLKRLPQLLELPPRAAIAKNGAEEAAQLILRCSGHEA